MEGINSRLDGIQAAILNIKLKYIDNWNRARHQNAMKYNERLSTIAQIHKPKTRENAFPIFHLHVIRTDKRDALVSFLKSKGINIGNHYPTELPFMPAYDYLGHKPSDFPNSFSNSK